MTHETTLDGATAGLSLFEMESSVVDGNVELEVTLSFESYGSELMPMLLLCFVDENLCFGS